MFLTRVQLIEALEMLSSELNDSTDVHDLVIAGGAALVLLYDARSSTKDVDAVVSDSIVREAALRVASRLDLPDDWLNDGAKGYLHGVAAGEVILETATLVVRALAPQQLLAMKLSAWRDDIDIADAQLLLTKLEGSKDVIWQQVEPYLVIGRELKARYAFEDIWESIHGTT